MIIKGLLRLVLCDYILGIEKLVFTELVKL